MTAEGHADTSEPPAVEALMATSRVMTAVLARTMSAVEETVSVPQFRLLVMLRYEGTLSMKEIAAGLGVNSSNVSRACDKLVRSGLVLRTEAEHDRRIMSVSLTPEGRALVDSLMQARAELLEGAVAHMSPTDQRELVQSLTAFLTAVEDSGLSEQLVTRNAAAPIWIG